jgi:hypothetical protein
MSDNTSIFQRGLGKPLLETLRGEALFKGKLREDIDNGHVFFAVRNGYGSFYYKGRSLFKYTNQGFSTHQKFGFIPDTEEMQDDYIREGQLAGLSPIRSFADAYVGIKKRAARYSEAEARGVSELFKFAPRKNHSNERYFLVDIRIAFPKYIGAVGKRTFDRVDILLYDNTESRLLFCQAKRFVDPGIWAKGGEPAVIEQLERYDRQIGENRDDILGQYKVAFAEYNELVGTQVNAPKKIHPQCGLLIFDFDEDDKPELVARMDNRRFYGRPCRIIGHMINESAKSLYEAHL